MCVVCVCIVYVYTQIANQSCMCGRSHVCIKFTYMHEYARALLHACAYACMHTNMATYMQACTCTHKTTYSRYCLWLRMNTVPPKFITRYTHKRVFAGTFHGQVSVKYRQGHSKASVLFSTCKILMHENISHTATRQSHLDCHSESHSLIA
jgi:hypothetical protein